ncbi:hypothetical protein HWV62_45577 [Athelia sp. TMB]|nr:hypothetical protein HWV62_45577 [Athelia sp. TMB]
MSAAGNINQFWDPKGWAFHKNIADTYGPVVKHSGLASSQLWVSDPKALQYIVVKEQDIYEETDLFIQMYFGLGLLGTLDISFHPVGAGERHRKQRKMLNPVFSSRHLQDMVPIFYSVSYKLRDTILARVKAGPQELDMLQWFGRTALELIGQSGLGYSFDNLDDGPAHPYSLAIKNFILTLLLPYVSEVGPPALRRMLLKCIPSANVQSVRRMVDLMDKTSREVILSNQRNNEDASEKVAGGKDIMSILLKANTEAAEEDRLTDAEVLGQVSTMVFAATDTTSSALSRIFHLLAQHPDVQDRLRQEICAARNSDGDLDYKQLDGLQYLDAIIRETLRLARKDTVLPLSRPIIGLDGTEVREIAVPKGTVLTVAIMRANRDPEIWGADAQEWKPERWLAELPENVTTARFPGVYSNISAYVCSTGVLRDLTI